MEAVTISIDGSAEQPCDAAPISLLVGSHEVITTHQGISQSERVDIARDAETAMAVETPREFALDDLQKKPWFWGGAGLAGVGSVLFLSAVYMDIFVLGPDIDHYEDAARDGDTHRYDELGQEIEDTQGTVTALYISGALLAAAGATLIFYPPDEWGVFGGAQAWLAPDAGGVQVSFSW